MCAGESLYWLSRDQVVEPQRGHSYGKMSMMKYRPMPESVKTYSNQRMNVDARCDYAFTLIELLVVISIIGLLIALLLPALASAKEAGNSAKCLRNCKTFATLTQQYLNDNEDTFPVNAWNSNSMAKQMSWEHEFANYLGIDIFYEGGSNPATETLSDEEGSSSVWACPSDRDMDRKSLGYGFHGPNIVTYAANRPGTELSHSREPWRATQFQHPDSTMAIVESWTPSASPYSAYSNRQNNYPGSLDIDADSDGFIDSASKVYNDSRPQFRGRQTSYNLVGARHPNRTANFTYLDGHAAGRTITYIMARPQNNNDLWGSAIWVILFPNLRPINEP